MADFFGCHVIIGPRESEQAVRKTRPERRAQIPHMEPSKRFLSVSGKISLGTQAMQLWKVSLVLVYAYPISLWTVLLFSSLVPRGRRGERSEDLKKNRYYKIVWTLQCLLVLCFVSCSLISLAPLQTLIRVQCVSAFLSISPYVTSISQHGNIRLQESYLVSLPY